MAGLSDVVIELQEQNRTLADVKESIRGILLANEAVRKASQREEGDKEEERREKSKAKTQARASSKPARSFAEGFGQGSGFSDFKSMVPSFLGGAGLLGGATIGGLLGGAAGRLFFPAIGAFFGAKYADKWVKPLTDKIFGDDATFEVFGKDVDASKIAAGVGGALAVMFSAKGITQVAKGMLGVGDDTKTGDFRKKLVRKFGLGTLALSLAGTVGDYIEDATGNVNAGNITENLINGAGLAAMFVPGGFLLKAMATFAIAGAGFIKDYMERQAQLRKDQFQDEIDRIARNEELDTMSDNMLIDRAKTFATTAAEGFSSGRGVSNYEATRHHAYLDELEKRNPKEAELVLLRNEIETTLLEMNKAGSSGALVKSSYMKSLQDSLNEYKALSGVDHPAQAQLKALRDGLYDSPSLPVDPILLVPPLFRPGPNNIPKEDTSGLSFSDGAGYSYSFGGGQKMAKPMSEADWYNSLNEKYGGNGAGNNVDASVSTVINNVSKSDRVVNQIAPQAFDMIDRRYNRMFLGIPGQGMYGF